MIQDIVEALIDAAAFQLFWTHTPKVHCAAAEIVTRNMRGPQTSGEALKVLYAREVEKAEEARRSWRGF